jgi:lysophospholipase L1-like esterase
MNGALYNAGQQNSLAALLAQQFSTVGGGAFNQPDINSQNGFYGVAPDGTTIVGRLRLSAANNNRPAPIIPGDFPTAYTGDKAALNNFAVPLITLGLALIPETGTPGHAFENVLYTRFASNPGTSTIIGDAAAALANGGTFFTFWLGNNDVLGYATGGASNPDILTSVENFQQRYQAALGALLQANPQAKGMISNIPNIIDIPFFRTVAFNAIPLEQENADQLNAGYAQFNGGINAYNAGMLPGQTGAPSTENQRPAIVFAAGSNAIVIHDETLPDLTVYGIPSIRQATNDDLILLNAGDVLGTDRGAGPRGLADPLEDQFVLIPQEQEEIQKRFEDFNDIIASVAAANTDRVGMVDINSIFNNFAQNGFVGNGVFITSQLAPPYGAFSLDGVHPNSRGYAFTANEFIKAINEKFNATIPLLNIGRLGANEPPQ